MLKKKIAVAQPLFQLYLFYLSNRCIAMLDSLANSNQQETICFICDAEALHEKSTVRVTQTIHD